MVNKFVQGIIILLLPIGLYAADSLNDTINGEVQLSQGKRELLIIDEAVPEKQLLSSYLRPGVDIVQINSGEDGLIQLEKILAGYQNLDALHIVSHGRAGGLYLGDTLVDKQQLQQRPSVLAALDKALTDGADLLLFGCDIASTDGGEQLLQMIANQARVDVAASINLTGNAALGGDWDLEAVVGQIDTEQPFSELALNNFSALLALPGDNTTFTFASGWTNNTTDLSHAYFTLTGSDFTIPIADVNITAGEAHLDIFGGAPADDPGILNVAADGVDVETFQLTQVVVTEAGAYDFDNIYITGYVNGGGTVTSTTEVGTGGQDIFTISGAELATFSGVDLTAFEVSFTPDFLVAASDLRLTSFTTTSAVAPGGGDVTPPTISAVSIANSVHKVGDTVTATITVTSDTDDYTGGSGGISGTIAGYALGSLNKTNHTTYTTTFTITDAGIDVAAGSNVPLSVTLDDSSGNTSGAFTTAISQASDAIYANVPDVTLTADTNTIAEDGGVSTLTASLTNSLNNQWPEDVSVNLAYTGTGTAGTDYSKSDSIVISAGTSSNTVTVTGTADTLFDAAAAETAIVDIDSLSVGNEGAPNQQSISITDAESAPSVTLSVANNTIVENGGTSIITAALSHPTFADVTVNLAYSGSAIGAGTDYATPSSSITINALSSNANAVTGITAVDDGDIGVEVNVIIDIASVTGGGGATENGAQQQTITIPDDDGDSIPPTITAVALGEGSYSDGDYVTVFITVATDTDDYTSGVGGIEGRVNGASLETLARFNDSTYISVFLVTEGVTGRSAGESIPVSIRLTDSNGNTSSTFATAITQHYTTIAASCPVGFEGIKCDVAVVPCGTGFEKVNGVCTMSEVTLRDSVSEVNTTLDAIVVPSNVSGDGSGNSCAATSITISGSVIISDTYTRVGVAAFNDDGDLLDGITLENATNGSTVNFTLEDLPSGTYIIKALGYAESTANGVTTEIVTAEVGSSKISKSISGLILSFADGSNGNYDTSSCSVQVSTETVKAIETVIDTVNTLTSASVEGVTSGNVGIDSALDLVRSTTDALQKAGDATQAGGKIDSTKIEQSLSSISDVLTALDANANNGTTLSTAQKTTTEALTNSAVMAVTDTVDKSTTADEAKKLTSNVAKLVSSSQELTGTIGSELTSNLQSLSQNALENTLGDIAKKVDSSFEITFTDVLSTQTLLNNNTQLLSTVVDTIGIKLSSTIKLDQASKATELKDAGLSSSAATTLATSLAQFVNPTGVSLTTSSGKVTAADSIASSLSSVSSDTVKVSYDNANTKTELKIGESTFPVNLASISIVPASIPNGISTLPNGSALSVANGLASKIVPASADPVGFASSLSKIGADVSFKSNGSVAITSPTVNFSGTFAFENASSNGSSSSTDVSFTSPTGSSADPSYNYKVNYPNGSTQKLLPYVKDNDFFDSAFTRKVSVNTNRSTGIVRTGTESFKPDYFVTPLSSADSTFLNANKDSTGTAYRKADKNGDGIDDWEVISSTGVQIIYGTK